MNACSAPWSSPPSLTALHRLAVCDLSRGDLEWPNTVTQRSRHLGSNSGGTGSGSGYYSSSCCCCCSSSTTASREPKTRPGGGRRAPSETFTRGGATSRGAQEEALENQEEEELGLTDDEKKEQREAHESALNAVRELPGTQSVASQFPHLVDKAVDAFLKERLLTDEEVALMGKERDLPPVPPHQMVGALYSPLIHPRSIR